MFCKKCGQQLRDGDAFCIFCGAAVKTGGGSQQTEYSDRTAKAVGARRVNDRTANSVGVCKVSDRTTSGVNVRKVSDRTANTVVARKKKEKKRKHVNWIVVVGGVWILAIVLCLLAAYFIFKNSDKTGSDNEKPEKSLKEYLEGQSSEDVWENSLDAKKAQQALGLYDEEDYEISYQLWKDSFERSDTYMEYMGYSKEVKVKIEDIDKISSGDDEFKWACRWLAREMECSTDQVQKFAIIKASQTCTLYKNGSKSTVEETIEDYLMVQLKDSWFYTGLSETPLEEYLEMYYAISGTNLSN